MFLNSTKISCAVKVWLKWAEPPPMDFEREKLFSPEHSPWVTGGFSVFCRSERVSGYKDLQLPATFLIYVSDRVVDVKRCCGVPVSHLEHRALRINERKNKLKAYIGYIRFWLTALVIVMSPESRLVRIVIIVVWLVDFLICDTCYYESHIKDKISAVMSIIGEKTKSCIMINQRNIIVYYTMIYMLWYRLISNIFHIMILSFITYYFHGLVDKLCHFAEAYNNIIYMFYRLNHQPCNHNDNDIPIVRSRETSRLRNSVMCSRYNIIISNTIIAW